MAKNKITAVLMSAGLLLGGVFGGFALDKDQTVDTSQFVTKADLGNATAHLATDNQVTSLQNEVLKEVNWEATAEVLALQELEEDNHEDLREWVASQYELTEDAEDIEDFSVSVRDVDFSEMDHDDENGIVTFDLKVYFENNDGDKVKKYVTAVVSVEDGEVEDVDFSETDSE